MCTISFLPNDRGFYLAVNRDEKRARVAALPPSVVSLDGARAIFPLQPGAGTWIAANDYGICLALINWHRIDREPAGPIRSRGAIIQSLGGKSSLKQISGAFRKLSLPRLRPFRLLGFSLTEQKIAEWKWDLETLAETDFPWARSHWFSSGYDEPQAELERARVCAERSREKSTGSLDWLRRLHRSHAPKRGPFSICMHRADAVTVSYTEVTVSRRHVVIRYKEGATCEAAPTIMRSLRRVHASAGASPSNQSLICQTQ
jgi:hypothetical protein